MRETCAYCGQKRDGSDKWGGPDPCLGHLPGVISACCGHGGERGPYLWTETTAYAGREAYALMVAMGGEPPSGDYAIHPAHPLSDRNRERA
jgi:hypothetical protein